MCENEGRRRKEQMSSSLWPNFRRRHRRRLYSRHEKAPERDANVTPVATRAPVAQAAFN